MIELFRHIGLVVIVGLFSSLPSSADVRVNKLLAGDEDYGLAVPFASFTAPNGTAAPDDVIYGSLSLDMSAFSGGFQALYDRDSVAAVPGNRIRDLPKFDFEFVSVDQALVPVEKGIVETQHPYFDWIVSPGSVWQLADGSIRMSIPFALMEKGANCVHNGVLLVDVGATDTASRALVQIGSETCAYFKFNFWAAYDASWQDQDLADPYVIVNAYNAELAAMLSREPISKLNQKYSDFNAAALAQQDEIAPINMTVYGLVLDGTHYTADCMTRMGLYPHCDTMALPSYSLAKSLAGGLGLMRLEKLYPGAIDAYVADLVGACSGNNWKGVQLKHLLNMTTGNYQSSKPHVDEGAAHYVPFFTSNTSADKTDFSCNHFKRKSSPGKKWVYHTSDTYLLGAAMNAFLTKNTGGPADYYNDLLVPLWNELELSPLTHSMRRTTGPRRQPLTGYGMVFYRDDIARAASSLTRQVGAFKTNFSEAQLAAALQLDEENRGMAAGAKTLRYKNGFWGWNAKNTLRCKDDIWIPFLSGYGGISVVLLPRGDVFYYFSDGGVHTFSSAIKEISKITQICEAVS